MHDKDEAHVIKDDAYDTMKYALYDKEFKAEWYDDSKELEPVSLESVDTVTPEQVFAMLKEMN